MVDEGQGLGDVTPRKKAGWTTYLIIAVIAALVIGGVTLFTGNGDNGEAPGNGGTTTNTPVTIPQLKSSLDSLTATVKGFGGRIATLETSIAGLVTPSVNQTDIDSLQASINSLSSSLSSLEAIVANFTDNGDGGNGTAYLGEISRWDFDSLRILGCTDDYTFEVVSKSPSRIEDEDLYELTVMITNTDETYTDSANVTHNATAIALNYELEIILSPRDYCVVDEDATYLDSDSYPYLNWDADFVTRTREGQEVCRRITFTSEKHNFGSLAPGDSLELDLVFELYYA